MDYSAANHALWNIIIQMGLIAGAILLANLLRQRVSLIRRSLMPIAVLGGFLLLIVKIIGLVDLDEELLEMLVYHGIALGFIAMSLRVPSAKDLARKGDLTGLKSGAVIVSTPQQVALADARKGIDMYRNEKVNVPILGLIENMAWFTPAELPENRYYIFGREGCKQLAEEMNVPLLAQIPLVQSICDNGDAGTPAALNSDSATGLAFINLAQAVVTVVNRRNREQPKTKIVGTK